MAHTFLHQAFENGRTAEARRVTELYNDIWSRDPNYGTAHEWVLRTLQDRIYPHMAAVGLGSSTPIKVIDFGAGDGRLLRELIAHRDENEGGTTGVAVDVFRPSITPPGVTWLQQPLWEPVGVKVDYALSTDALEHLPEWSIGDTLLNIKRSAPHGFHRIATKPDEYGSKRGLRLHETVRPPDWWLKNFEVAGFSITEYKVYVGRALEVWY